MKRAISFLFLFVCGQLPLKGDLVDYLSPKDKRFASFAVAKELIKSRHLETWVETGTARNGASNCAGDDCSTIIYSDWLQELPGEIYSVDIDPQAIAEAKAALRDSVDQVHFVTSDSVKFLTHFPKPIDFLYLDSFDFDFKAPYPSQRHHLKEIHAALNKLHANSVVMIDDCDLPYGGKGKLAIEYLIKNGWTVVFKGYQVILVKNV